MVTPIIGRRLECSGAIVSGAPATTPRAGRGMRKTDYREQKSQQVTYDVPGKLEQKETKATKGVTPKAV